MTTSAPRERTNSMFLVLVTAVTSAPKTLASWTDALPHDPDAPYTRSRVP
jgi:hypothetical protein